MAENKQSTKWIDYSDQSELQDSEDEEVNKRNQSKGPSVNHPRKMTQLEAEKYEKLGEHVWLLARIVNESRYQNLRNLIFDMRKRDSNFRVYVSKEQNTLFDVKVSKTISKQILQTGLQGEKGIQWTLHQRNFQKKRYSDEQRRDRKERNRGRGDKFEGNDRRQNKNHRDENRKYQNRGHGQQEGQKKTKYVDKQTGKQSDNKKVYELRKMEEKQRQYSKKQAQIRGQQFANFRKTTLQQRRKEQDKKPEIVSDKIIKNTYIQKGSKHEVNQEENKEETQIQNETKNQKKGKKKYVLKNDALQSKKENNIQQKNKVKNKKKHFIEIISEEKEK